MFHFRPTLTFPALASALALMGLLGCGGSNGGTALYVYDQTSATVQVWGDVNKLYDAAGGTVPGPDRTISIGAFSDGRNLAWGGAVLDDNRNLLYLLDEGGTVTIINNVSSKNGSYSSTSDVTYFTLGTSSDHISTGAFGQLALDSTQNTLYAMETSADGANTRVWFAANASQYSSSSNSGTNLPSSSNTFTSGNDTYGTGLAVFPGNTVFGLFGGGNTLYYASVNSTAYTGPRLRLGSGNSFPSSTSGYNTNYFTNGVLIGSSTLLTAPVQWGSLAYDSQNSLLYALPQHSGAAQVLAFTRGQFNQGPLNQAPNFILADPSGNSAGLLRTISHPISSDWLLGLDYTAPTSSTDSNGVVQTGTGLSSLVMWKNPSGGGSTAGVVVDLAATGTTYALRGVTMGGN